MNEALKVVVKRNFLTPEDQRGLATYALTHEAHFTQSTIIPRENNEPAADLEHRRSRVLFGPGPYASLISDRIRASLPEILSALRHEAFPLWYIDTQITASNDGDFFGMHRDDGAPEPVDIPLRELSFVYYFHSEPKGFRGGQLRFYDFSDGEPGAIEDRSKTIIPRQNTIVFFPSSYDHEVLPVKCPSRKFANSRFTLNGWLIREPASSDD